MADFWIFAGNHPFVTLVIAYFALEAFIYPFKVMSRFFRSMNIKNAGWPPAHLDADGDAVEKPE